MYFDKKYIVFTGKKCADLVRQFIMTQMALHPHGEFGNPTIKSIIMCSHFYSGIGSDCSGPTSFWYPALTCWHCRHCATNSTIYFFIQVSVYLRSSWMHHDLGIVSLLQNLSLDPWYVQNTQVVLKFKCSNLQGKIKFWIYFHHFINLP